MTAEDFKRDYPKHAHLEGIELIDAMTMAMLRQQQGEAIIRTSQSFFKRYRLRWLFYRNSHALSFGRNNYTASNMCSICRKGVSSYVVMNYEGRRQCFCPHGSHELVQVPNNTLHHSLWLKWVKIKSVLETVLDKLHIVRKPHENRYSIFGDERHYMHQTINMETYDVKNIMHSRRWWEYVFIKI
ncbi:MAG TPA: hypothetical protein VN698_16425 [Bacteroidia bacterium]|nr:hypothetical protein [Bacteroidia bacterium]